MVLHLQQQVVALQATQRNLQQQLDHTPNDGQPMNKRSASLSDVLDEPRPTKRTNANQDLPADQASQLQEVLQDTRLVAIQVEATLFELAAVSLRPGAPRGLMFAESARNHGHEPMGLCLVCWRDVGRGAYCCDEDCEGL